MRTREEDSLDGGLVGVPLSAPMPVAHTHGIGIQRKGKYTGTDQSDFKVAHEPSSSGGIT